MKGRCEVFDRKRCFGCVGLDPQYDIENLKTKCEVYQEEMGIKTKHKQIKIEGE